jgi:hypothetical protein
LAKYGGFAYRGAYYGEIPRLPFSVEPFQAVAVDYNKIQLFWGPPQGAINGLRLVRSQVAFSEWPDDGVILFEINSDDGDFGDTFYTDGIDNFDEPGAENDIPLVSGRFVYYRMWVRRSETNLWNIADDVVVLLPKEHGTVTPEGQVLATTHDNFMNLLPRVYTSIEQSPLGVVDTTSDLYNFLKAFSFTLDELLTFADLLLPDFSGQSTSPDILDLQVYEYGITPASDDVILNQKKMVREAIYMYSRKGTPAALSTLVESLTGFGPVITSSPNLFLTPQDSTFYTDLGKWTANGQCTLTLTDTIFTPSGEDFQIDDVYTAKAVATNSSAFLRNGTIDPVLYGIPVTAGVEYTFSSYAQRTAAAAVSIIPKIYWYNNAGVLISTTTGATQATTVSWDVYEATGTAPGTSFEVVSYEVTSNEVSLDTNVAHNVEPGATITVLGLGAPYDGKYTVDAVTATVISYSLTTPDVVSTATTGLVSIEAAVYAGVEIGFSKNGTVYFDMMQFATSDVTRYYEARSVDIFLQPDESNFVNDSSFSAITTDWAVTGESSLSYPTSTAPYLFTADSMLSVVPNAGQNLVISADTNTGGMPVGKFYTFSTYAQSPDNGENMYLKVTAVDSVNASVVIASDPVTVGATWTRLEVSIFVPPEFVSDSMFFTLEVRADANTGGTINVEAAQLEPNFTSSLFIAGNFPAEYGIVWEGQVDSSPSHLYKNRQAKTIRLIQELEKFLPSNTPYVVNTFGGVETKAITM